MKSITFVLPVLNESRILVASTVSLHEYLSRNLSAYNWRILVVDNGSIDETMEIANDLAHSYPRVEFIRTDIKGRGRAIKKGWLETDSDYLVYMDIDLSTELNAIPELVEAVDISEYDIAIGSRLVDAAVVLGRSHLREILSRVYSMMIGAMFGNRFKDAQCGFKAIRRRTAQAILPFVKDNGWFFDTELLLLAENNGYRIKELPIRWVDDRDSRVDIFNTVFRDVLGLLRLRFGGLRKASKHIRDQSQIN